MENYHRALLALGIAGISLNPTLTIAAEPASTKTLAMHSAGSSLSESATNQAPPLISPPLQAAQKQAATPATTLETVDETELDDDDIAVKPEVNIDPYEKFNRTMFKFNDTLDRWILRPIAKGYDTVLPSPIRKGIGNFFANLSMLITIPNDLLQGKPTYFVTDTWRFVLNSTLGIGGLFDVATGVGLPKHYEDFGLTLAYWSGDDGLKPQPYLVLPFLGPTTTRDAFARIPSAAIWPLNYVQPQYYNFGALGLDTVSKRADLMPADKLVQDAFDPYIFVRSAYLQNRNHEIERNRRETNSSPYTAETEAASSDEDNL